MAQQIGGDLRHMPVAPDDAFEGGGHFHGIHRNRRRLAPWVLPQQVLGRRQQVRIDGAMVSPRQRRADGTDGGMQIGMLGHLHPPDAFGVRPPGLLVEVAGDMDAVLTAADDADPLWNRIGAPFEVRRQDVIGLHLPEDCFVQFGQ